MLVLTRKVNQRIRFEFGQTVAILEVTQIKGNRVLLGVTAPLGVRILREELVPSQEETKQHRDLPGASEEEWQASLYVTEIRKDPSRPEDKPQSGWVVHDEQTKEGTSSREDQRTPQPGNAFTCSHFFDEVPKYVDFAEIVKQEQLKTLQRANTQLRIENQELRQKNRELEELSSCQDKALDKLHKEWKLVREEKRQLRQRLDDQHEKVAELRNTISLLKKYREDVITALNMKIKDLQTMLHRQAECISGLTKRKSNSRTGE